MILRVTANTVPYLSRVTVEVEVLNDCILEDQYEQTQPVLLIKFASLVAPKCGVRRPAAP